MATFQENLAKIRGQAIYGPDMRTAIAEAIEQVDDQAEAVQTIIDNHLFYLQVTRMGNTNDYIFNITEGEAS